MAQMTTAPVSSAETAKAAAELRRMKSSLAEWLKIRQRNNDIAAGKVKAKVTPRQASLMISHGRDWAHEQKLAVQIHALLSEVMDGAKLPSPDLNHDPDALVKLAKIVVAGGVPGEAASPEAQGIVWLWPATIVVGLVLLTLVTKIRNDADVAKHKETIECIKMGGCTDYGFWLKVGGLAAVGWFVWEKMGVGDRVRRAVAK